MVYEIFGLRSGSAAIAVTVVIMEVCLVRECDEEDKCEVWQRADALYITFRCDGQQARSSIFTTWAVQCPDGSGGHM